MSSQKKKKKKIEKYKKKMKEKKMIETRESRNLCLAVRQAPYLYKGYLYKNILFTLLYEIYYIYCT